MRSQEELQIILKSRIVIDPNGCWLYQGYVSTHGYGMMSHDNYPALVHRVSAWAFLNIPVNKDIVIMHSCDVKRCINPDHFKEGNHSDNTMDAVLKGRFNGNRPNKNRNKTRCPKGHLFDNITSQGYRECSECKTEKRRAYYVKNKK